MFISGPLAVQNKAFSLFHEQVGHGTILFYPLESFPREWTAFRCEQTENIQILYRPWRVSIHRSMCYSQRNEFSTSLVDFVNLPDLKIIQFCIFLSWIRLSNGGMLSIYCKIALLLYFPLWPVRHFENSQRRACALLRVSGRVHLEPRKTNVRRAGERVWYDKLIIFYVNCMFKK